MNFLNKNLYLFFAGRLVSILGTLIQYGAVPLYILDKTQSGTIMGVFTMLSLLPAIIIAPFAGVIGDRFNRKKIMVIMDLINGVLILTLFGFAYFDYLNITVLFIMQVLISVTGMIFRSATAPILVELVDDENLLKANSLRTSIDSIASIVGPLVGAVLYGSVGIAIVFLINGVSFLISGISEIFIEYEAKNVKKDTGGKKSPINAFKDDFKEGMKFIINSKAMIFVAFFALAANVLIAPTFGVVFPYVLRIDLQVTAFQYGLITSTFTVGILAGSILVMSGYKANDSRYLIRTGMIMMTSLYVLSTIFLFPNIRSLFGGDIFIVLILAFLFIGMGLFNAFINNPIGANFQRLIPNELRSRVNSTNEVISSLAIPFGSVLFGFLIDKMNQYILMLASSILFAFVILYFLLRAPEEIFNTKKVEKAPSGEIAVNPEG